MNWSKGFTAKYYATIVDPKMWRDIQTFKIAGGSIKLTDTALRESADINTKYFDTEDEYWVRVYMEARQEDETPAKVALFTGLASVPNRSYHGKKLSSSISCYSVLKPAEDVPVPLGWYANAGSNGARLIYDLLKEVTPAPIVILGTSPGIDREIVAEPTDNHLTIIDYILDIIDWRLRISGDGTITLGPTNYEPIVYLDADKYDVIEMDVNIENNWFDCPNVFRAINDDMTAIAKDEDPESRFSIPRRGREIWMTETSVNLNNNETIGEYANRRLKEEQLVGYSLSYGRRFHPDIRPSDAVHIRYPQQNISGTFVSTSQTIELGHGCRVSEDAIGVGGVI